MTGKHNALTVGTKCLLLSMKRTVKVSARPDIIYTNIWFELRPQFELKYCLYVCVELVHAPTNVSLSRTDGVLLSLGQCHDVQQSVSLSVFLSSIFWTILAVFCNGMSDFVVVQWSLFISLYYSLFSIF